MGKGDIHYLILHHLILNDLMVKVNIDIIHLLAIAKSLISVSNFFSNSMPELENLNH